MPNVLTAEVLGKLKIDVAEFNKAFAPMMAAGLKRLGQLQRSKGGWGWYDRSDECPLMTAMAVHGLSESQRLGYAVDRVMLRRGRARLAELIKTTQDLDHLAYGAHVLGQLPERLLAEIPALSPHALAMTLLTLKRLGKPTARVSQMLIDRATGDHWPARGAGWRTSHGNWSTDIESTAWALRALHATRPDHPSIGRGAEWLLGRRQGNRWRSTKDTAAAIAALLQVVDLRTLAAAAGADAKGPRPALRRDVRVTFGDRPPQTLRIDLNDALQSRHELHVDRVAPGAQSLTLTPVERQTGLPFDVEVAWLVRRRPGKSAGPAPRGLRVAVTYDRPLTGLRVGQEVVVTLTTQADTALPYVMLHAPIPAGCEVVRGSGEGTFDRFEARHEQASFFVASVGSAPLVLRFRMRCRLAGRYRVGAPIAVPMYDDARQAIGRERIAVIKK